MNSCKIFIVEDDPWFGEIIKHHLSLNPDYEIQLFKTANECLRNLSLKPDIICIDFGLPDLRGDELLQKIQQHNKSIPVIVISGQEDISVAVKLFKLGVSDYIEKGEHSREMLWNSILKIRETLSLKKEVEVLKEQLGQKYSFQNNIIGQSDAFKKTLTLIDKASKTNINICISGETGTGKEVVAKAIHFSGERSKFPFIAVNMAAIPKELVESELFGHEKGAFTGADTKRIGKFEEANNGTLFLDEIAELDLSLQSKILRALQEREIVRVGGNIPIKFNARLITASHKNLSEEVRKGNFREDLFYRIIGLPIELPALRSRGNDIIILAKHFMLEFSKENKLKNISFTKEAIQKLLKHAYPGNVRELKALIELACVMSDGKNITEHNITFATVREIDSIGLSQEKTLKEHTAEIISHYLKKYNNNVVEVAKKLDVGKSTIYNMIQKKELNSN
jgi:two-component system response regulator AtoC